MASSASGNSAGGDSARPIDWQGKKLLSERAKYILKTGLWSDCEFIVGIDPNKQRFPAHKLILAMSSPVFETMFYGSMAEKDVIEIPDVQPEAFKALLAYIYTDSINIRSFNQASEICYVAKKYMLPSLVEAGTNYLWQDIYPKNACRAYEFAKLFEETIFMDKCLDFITHQTEQVISESTFEDIEHSTLLMVLSQNNLTVSSELVLFKAIQRWSLKECMRKNLDPSTENQRNVLGEALFKIRYLTMTTDQFASGPAVSGLLTQDESFAFLMNISSPGKWPLPDHLSAEQQSRKQPLGMPEALALTPMPPAPMPPADPPRMITKFYCKREILQEPHCLNTNVLDCSVTFMVDKNICVQGIEVPSQVLPPRRPEGSFSPALEAAKSDVWMPPHGLPGQSGSIQSNPHSGYTELLYSHLLDSDSSRLTYTHFTSRVHWNDLVEIHFNRPIYIQKNKVYRIGVVLNKSGWYPMGICTRRVSLEGVLFTFCVGLPEDNVRDGLIRSIIFSH